MDPETELYHIGTPRHSGRYKWGSGKDPYQRSGDFESRVKELEDQGHTEKEIADMIGLSINHLRIQRSLARDERRSGLFDTADALRKKGYSPTAIAKEMGYKNESSVRSLLDPAAAERMRRSQATADILRDEVEKKRMVDVGPGVERELNISRDKLDRALYMLEMEGYNVYRGGVPQVSKPGTQTNRTVLCKPDVAHKEIYEYDKVQTLKDYVTHDGGQSFTAFVYPESMDSSRVKIRYAEEGGIHKDGVIELRRGVPDLSLGDSHYAQVRILVDGDKYLKGMAIYATEDMPKGTDVIFNTNKKVGTPKEKVLKPITDDPNNPFGSAIKAGGQSYYDDPNGKYTNPITGKKQSLSLINKRAEEGDWSDWKDGLPSQFLAKQSRSLIKKQLDEAANDKQKEYEEICALTNPTVKKVRLKAFSDSCDSAAVHLSAAALPGQKYHVILPITTMKDTEVFAPKYDDGTKVALIRYPHGGTFEIPILTVNNKHADAVNILGKDVRDTIGISSKVAERLSGADFDGDTVMVIPTGNRVHISSRPPLKDLEGFDPKEAYPYREGMTLMKRPSADGKKIIDNTGLEMGVISNLITDMTLKGADDAELARAVRHSMVVIDAGKHKLDYKKSEADNGIAALKKTYQGTVDEDGRYHEGASTLISRAKSEEQVLKRKGSPKVNIPGKEWYDPSRPEGALIYKSVHEEYVDPKTGKTKTRMQSITKMENTDDARTLSSGTIQEELYANYANRMKALANTARKEMVSTTKIQYSPQAREEYRPQVDSLMAKLNTSLKNAPRERQAQAIANSVADAKKKANPGMSKAERQKVAQRELTAARDRLGARRKKITFSDLEWEAIQKGAITENVLTQILENADQDEVTKRATPRTASTITTAKANKIKNMQQSNYTIAQIAQSTGLSATTVANYIGGKE